VCWCNLIERQNTTKLESEFINRVPHIPCIMCIYYNAIMAYPTQYGKFQRKNLETYQWLYFGNEIKITC
jgi:hypothetical protein